MTYSAWQPRRLMALVLTLALLVAGWTVPAYAQEDWELLNIRLTWQDAGGNTYETYASPVSWSEDHAYWAQVSADAPLTALTLYVSHPNHAYTFDPADGSTLLNVVDAGTTVDMLNAITLTAYENDAPAAVFSLFISTSTAMPEEPQPEPAQADVSIRYVAADGSFDESETRHMVEGEDNTVWAKDYPGYTPDQQSVYVDVSAGGANPSSVTFT